MTHSYRSRVSSSWLALVTTLALALTAIWPPTRVDAVAGAVTITTLGAPVGEDFNALISTSTATWVNDSTIPGWYHARSGSGTTIVANNGSSNAGNLYSYGATSNSERALGSVGSGNAAAGNFYWGVRIANGTSSTITSLTLSYRGEQWRNGGAPAQTVDFSYRVGTGLGNALTDFTTGGVAVPELSFTSPITGGAGAALDGNVAPNNTALSHTITGLSLSPGAEILLRWADVDHAMADHGMAIDDFIITANGSGTPAVSIDDVSVTEGNSGTTTATFTVSVSSADHGGVSFDIATADGTGSNAATVADGDYVARAETGQVIPAGQQTYSFAVTVNGDTFVEGDEAFTVNLASVGGATVLDDQGIGTIANDDAAPPTATGIVISQIYGGGGNAGATLTHDFVELFNRTTTTISLAGWSLQYQSSTGTGTWQTTPLSGSIPPGGYYLVQEGQGSGGTQALPAPDASGTIAMAAGAGKIALRTSTAAFAGSCPASPVDFVGYGAASCFEGAGPTAALSNTTAAQRKRAGCIDSDNNNIDFSIGSPIPRNSASPHGNCSPTPAAIHEIQGSGLSTPFAGQYVTTSGIVTGLKSNGFFIEAPEAAWDIDPLTSEALFVFTGAAPAVVVGNVVSIGGTAGEFFDLTQIEASLPGDVLVTAPSGSVPGAVTLTSTILNPAGTPQQLEPYEGMRMQATSLTSVAPTNNFGETIAVLTGVARPMREPGIEISLPVPPDPSSGTPDCCIPLWDENPERIMIDSDGLAGAPVVSMTSNVTFGPVSGPLDFSFGDYKILPEAPPATTANMSGIAVPAPAIDELTVAGFNIENFDNDEIQRRKAALAIRQLMHSPDVIGHIEILNLTSLQALADQVNADAVAAGEANPGYQAFLIQAPAGGTQNVGFLVKTTRVLGATVTQEQGTATFINPNNGQPETLHDRPPLVLRATFDSSGVNPRPFIVVVNHLRSFIDIESVSGEGVRVRAKRTRQAEALAGLLQELQTANPGVPVVSIGDYNAYQFNDGYTDPISVLKGTPTPDEQVVVDQSDDVVDPNFVNLTDGLPVSEQYSFVFEGTPQALDHMLVNTVAQSLVQRYAIARGNADFPEDVLFTNDVTRPERSSDHDMPVAYFRFAPPPADLSLSMTAGSGTTDVGTNVVFTITVTNNGPGAAESVVVTDFLPPTTTFVSCAASGGGNCALSSGNPRATFATIGAGESRTVTVTATIACNVANGSVVASMAIVESGTADPDSGNNAAAASTTANNAPPAISGVSASRTRLLLPLHQMVPVTINYTASDSCGAVTTTLSVTSDEPVTGPILRQGLAGLTSPDWEVVNAHSVRLRAERSLSGDGRVYTITITSTDAAGGSSTGTVTVTVPR